MDAVEKTLTYRDDPGLYGKRLPTDKDKYPPKTEPDEPNYVDLVDMKSEGTKHVQVTSTGEGIAHDIIELDKSALAPNDRPGTPCECKVSPEDFPEEPLHDKWFDMTVTDEEVHTAGTGRDPTVDLGGDTLLQKEHDPRCYTESICSASDDMEYTDMYLNSKTESDNEEESEVLSDHCASDKVEDESHYITTHEIQLTELDHDVDYDMGRGGDCEDDNLVYTFVDYALFESDETHGDKKNKTLLNITHEYAGRAAGAQPESDSDNSSDESVFKNQCVNTHAQERLIHLSIKPAARAEDSSDTFSANGRVKPAQYRGRFLTHVNPRGCDFIPAPGRQHLATKLRWKDVNSSGASSSISELDDADKEVRNLTAKTFRSLACPYFDAINLSTSSESSMSEYGLGLNKWSAYVNLNHGNISQQTLAHKSSRATLAVNNAAEIKREESNAKAAQTKMHAMNKHETHSKQAPSSSSTIQTKQPQWGDVITLTETINFHVEAELPESRRQLKCSKSAHEGSRTKQAVAKGDTQTRATFASSHLKNVISKKMQFEQERQLVRGDYYARSPCFQCREQEHRRPSASGSELTVNSLEGIVFEGVTSHSCETQEDASKTKSLDKTHLPEMGGTDRPDPVEPQKARLNHSQSSAFTLLKGEAGPQTKPQASAAEQDAAGGGAVVNKSSHLFVPSSLLLSKEKDPAEQAQGPGAPTHAPGARVEEEANSAAKLPEIKIRLRPAKENKGHVLNIANLLTPQISNAVNTLKTAGCSRLQVLSAPDRTPHFTVRDVRENKCKFQAPIYRVRDVRKLVKSSYGFVSAENADGRCPPATATAPEPCEDKKDPVKHVAPSPIYIKCNSVKTNQDGKQGAASAAVETSQPKPQEVSGFSARGEGSSSHWSTGKGPAAPAAAKPPPPQDQQRPDRPPTGDPKVPNQAALEKLQAAVKTMEQLYVFDRNEWKRKGRAPQPVSHSHVLSLIASEEERGVEGVAAATGDPGLAQGSRAFAPRTFASVPSAAVRPEEHGGPVHVPGHSEASGARPRPGRTFCKKSVLHLDHSKPQHQDLPPSAPPRAPCPLQRSFKLADPKHGGAGASESGPTAATVTHSGVDPGNYLTIPRQGYTSEVKLLPPPSLKGEPPSAQPQDRSTDTGPPSATIYHRPAPLPQGPHQPQLPHVSPAASPQAASPQAQQTQRKMLLDVTTGFYYLVDTPLQPATRRLLDPETGGFVDVPVSCSPVTPIPLSPLTLSPGAYTPTYLMYPGPTPTPPAYVGTPFPPEAGGAGAASDPPPPPAPPSSSPHVKLVQRHETGAAASESPYYSATGAVSHVHAPARVHVPVRQHFSSRGGGAGGAAGRKPVISITTQQGPRIIAPPCFDGTTMSFVVEHR